MESIQLLKEINDRGWVSFHYEGNLIDFARLFGQPVPSRKGGSILSELRIVDSKEANPSSLSAIYGKGGFPCHTEAAYRRMPPRYVILRMKEGEAGANRPTILKDIINIASENELRVLREDIWIYSDNRTPFYSSILSVYNERYILRYDKDCMKFPLKNGSKSLSIMSSLIEKATDQVINWEINKTIIFDNWRMLHSRRESEDTILVEKRVLERVLVLEDKR